VFMFAPFLNFLGRFCEASKDTWCVLFADKILFPAGYARCFSLSGPMSLFSQVWQLISYFTSHCPTPTRTNFECPGFSVFGGFLCYPPPV